MKIVNTIFGTILGSIFCLNCLAASTSFNVDQTKDIEQIVHNYLVKNPEVLIEAMQTIQQKRALQMEQDSKKMLTKHAKEVFDASNKPIAGNAQGNIIIAEWFDYQCPHCKSMDIVIKKAIKDNPNLKVIYAEAPVISEESMYVAKAALAAMKQNKYLELHSALLANKNNLTKDEVLKIAKTIKGLDIAKLEKDMQDSAIEKQLEANIKLLKKLKTLGVPAFFITNNKNKKYDAIYGQFESEVLQQKINALN